MMKSNNVRTSKNGNIKTDDSHKQCVASSIMMALEPRVLLDAAWGETLHDLATDQSIDAFSDNSSDGLFEALQEPVAVKVRHADNLPVCVLPRDMQNTSIAFIDSAVEDFDVLIAAMGPNIEVHILDANFDGVAQMAAVLDGRLGVDAVHVISHGQAGSLTLGSAILSTASIQGEHAGDLAIIRGALSKNADILIYGCDFAAGDAGVTALKAFADATGADIAASVDTTGAADLGGDWLLEEVLGAVDTAGLVVNDYDHVLWTTADFGAGFFGDTPVNTPNATLGALSGLTSVGPMTGGPGIVLSHVTVSGGTTAFQIAGGSATATLANAQTQGDYMFTTIIVGAEAVRIDRIIFNQRSENAGTAQMGVVLVDTATNVGTILETTVNIDGTTNSVVITPESRSVMQEGGTYELRFYFFGSTANMLIDDPQFYTQINQEPTAVVDTLPVVVGVPTSIDVIMNDTDVDRDSLFVTEINGTAITVGTPVTLVSGTTLTLQADGTILANKVGATAESFTYKITDLQGHTATATANLTAAAANYLDLDSDGVQDAADIDDDNDGVLDTTEGLNPLGTSGVWTIAGNVATSDLGNGVFAKITKVSPNVFTATGSAFNPLGAGFWSAPLEGDASLTTVANWGDSYTISFVNASGAAVIVIDPILHLDRIGGLDGTIANSGIYTLQGGLTWSKLGGTDDFRASSTTVYDSTAGLQNSVGAGGESTMGSTTGTAAGSLRINGSVSSFTINVAQIGPDGSGQDGLEFIVQAAAPALDTDGDGKANYRDIDSDNDGITDNIEAQTTAGYIAPSGAGAGTTDANNDGLDDVYDAGALGTAGGIGLTPVNTDGADTADIIDANSDNDALTDAQENGLGIAAVAGISTLLNDADGDGLFDVYETAIDGNANDGFVVNEGELPLPASMTGYIPDGGDAIAGSIVPMTADLNYRDATSDNLPPVAVNDTATIGTNRLGTGSVAGNDSDPNLNTLTYTLLTQPTHGTAVMLADGKYLYTPNAGYTGPDSLTYTVSDGNGGTDTARLDITVQDPNDPPMINLNDGSTSVLSYAAAWTHGTGTTAPVALSAFTTSASNETAGLGLIHRVSGTGAFVSGITATNYLQSILNEEYLAYQFTTGASVDPGVYISGYARNNNGYTGTVAFQLATQADFSDAKTMADGGPLGGSGYNFFNERTALDPNTTYYARVYFYNTVGTQRWDDFGILLNKANPNFAATYNEDSAAVSVANNTLADVSDMTENDIILLTINGANFADGADEVITIAGQAIAMSVSATLTVTLGATPLTIVYDSASQDFSITRTGGGAMGQADLDTLVRGITYRDNSQDPTIGSNRTLTFKVTDSSGLESVAAVSTITVNNMNDSPVPVLNSPAGTVVVLGAATPTPTYVITPAEFSNPPVITVASLLAQLNITDVEQTNFGIAVTYAHEREGVWQFNRTDIVGHGWVDFQVDPGNADLTPVPIGEVILFNAATELRFVPKATFAGVAQLDFKAWDQTVGTPSNPPSIIPDTSGGAAPTAVSSLSALTFSAIIAADSDADGVANTFDIDDDNDGILDTVEGFVQIKESFESVVVANLNNNNIVGTSFGAVTMQNGSQLNIIKVNGTTYYSGPDNAADGNQYADIDGSNDYPVYQFTLTAGGIATISADFANRDSQSPFAFTPWDGQVELLDASKNVIAQGNILNFTQSLGDETWRKSSLSMNLAPGTYYFRGFVADYGHIDNINIEVVRDSDSDGIADHLDIDSDNDGITDNVEAQTTAGYISPSGAGALMRDADNDGLDDVYDTTSTGGAAGSVGLAPVNTDSTDLADYVDADSDNDGLSDAAERGTAGPTTVVTGLSTTASDADGDGLFDVFEDASTTDGFDVNDENLTGTAFNLGDADNDTAANGAGAIPLTNDLDFRDNNEPPVAVDDTIALIEDTPITANIITGNGVDSDPDGDTVSVLSAAIDANGDGTPDVLTLGTLTTLTTAGGVTIGTISLSSTGDLAFNPALNYNGPVPVLTYVISDGNNQTDTATVTLGPITPVNDVPVLNLDPNNNSGTPGDTSDDGLNDAGFETTFVENAQAVKIVDADLTLADPENNITGVTVTLVDGKIGDKFSFVGPLPGGITVAAVPSTTLTSDGPIVLSFIGAPGTTTADWNALLQLITFEPSTNNSQNPNPADRTITIEAVDGNNASSGQLTTIIHVIPENDLPTLDLDADDSTAGSGNYANTYTENGVPVPLSDGALITDLDDTNLESMTITLTNGELGDLLTIGNLPAGIRLVGVAPSALAAPGTMTLQLTGSASLANYQAAIAAIRFSSTSENPVESIRAITVVGSDGTDLTPVRTSFITLERVNDAPVATPMPPRTGADMAALTPFDVKPNFSDLDHTIAQLTFALDPATTPSWMSLDANGNIVGTPAVNASQNTNTVGGAPGVYTITVTATDPTGLTAQTTVTYTIANPAPNAIDDTFSAQENGATLFGNVFAANPLTSDSDPDGDTLAVTSVAGVPANVNTTIAGSAGGLFTIDAQGNLTFVDNGDFEGLDDGETLSTTVTYQISDGNGGFDTATITVVVSGTNDAPVIVDPLNPGTTTNPIRANPLTIVPLQNVTDGQDFTTTPLIALAPFAVDPDGEPVRFTTTSPLPAGLTLNPDGTITGTIDPAASQGGDPLNPGFYTIVVNVSDGTVTTPITVRIDVSNPAPVAEDDTASLGEDAAPISGNVITPILIGDVADVDAAPDRDVLNIVSAVQGTSLITIGTPFTTAGGGVLNLTSTGAYTFVPGTAYNGLDDSETALETITYTVSDGNGGFDTATLTITINGSNDAAVIVNPLNPGTPTNLIPADPLMIVPIQNVTDSQVFGPTTPLISLAPYAIDPDGDPVTFTTTSPLPAGLTLNPDGTITGTIDHSASQGGDPLSPGFYTIVVNVSDGTVTTPITVRIDVSNVPPINILPIPAVTTFPAIPFALDTRPFFTDRDGDLLNYTATGMPSGFSIDPRTGIMSGTPASDAYAGGPDADGKYSITVTVDDMQGGKASYTFLFVVQPEDYVAPVITNSGLSSTLARPSIQPVGRPEPTLSEALNKIDRLNDDFGIDRDNPITALMDYIKRTDEMYRHGNLFDRDQYDYRGGSDTIISSLGFDAIGIQTVVWQDVVYINIRDIASENGPASVNSAHLIFDSTLKGLARQVAPDLYAIDNPSVLNRVHMVLEYQLGNGAIVRNSFSFDTKTGDLKRLGAQHEVQASATPVNDFIQKHANAQSNQSKLLVAALAAE